MLKTVHLSVWFYFIPFIALSCNFLVPFLAEAFGQTDKFGHEAMSDDYMDWI